MEFAHLLLDNLNLTFLLATLAVTGYVVLRVLKGRNGPRGEEPERIRHIPSDSAAASPLSNWGALAGTLMFFTGGMPFMVGFPALLACFLGVGLLTLVVTRAVRKRTDWGQFAFLIGFAAIAAATYLLMRRDPPLSLSPMASAWIMGGGLLVTLFFLWRGARKRRASWLRVPARCVEREIFKDHSYADGGDMGKTWQFTLVCEFELGGGMHRVTPGFWRTFATRAGVERFLAKNISPQGDCELYVNPDDPLEAELVGRDIKDMLLH